MCGVGNRLFNEYMPILLINLVALCLVILSSRISFNDAQTALSSGIFSLTSVSGYSVTGGLFMYVFYIAIAIIFGLIGNKFYKDKLHINSVDSLQTDKRGVKGIVIFGILAAIIVPLLVFNFSPKVFEQNSIHSEEFYNAAASLAWQDDGAAYDVPYPYALSNLLFLHYFGDFSNSLFLYESLLGVIALIFLYYIVSIYSKNFIQKLLSLSALFSMWGYSIIVPSMHRNIFRFSLIIFFVYFLQFINARKLSDIQYTASHVLLSLFLLLFGSADIIAIIVILYLFYFIILIINKTELKRIVIYCISPIVSFLLLWTVLGNNLYLYFKFQLLSIMTYSGHVNAAPYPSILYILRDGWIEMFKQSIILADLYLPILIIFNLILIVIWKFNRKDYRPDSIIVSLTLFSLAYFMYFRQNLGDAGWSRVAVISGVMLPIILILRNRFEGVYIRIIYYLSIFFVISLSIVCLYFARFGITDIMHSNSQSNVAKYSEVCPESIVCKGLQSMNYRYFDDGIVSQLNELKKLVGNARFYVYDDTFSLYYLLDSRPITLTPSYSMGYSSESQLIEKMSLEKVEFIIVPKNSHFFGVPKEATDNPDFMKIIKNYMVQNYSVYGDLPDYKVYIKNK